MTNVKVGFCALADVRRVDAQTVTFHLDQPAPSMPATMSNVFSAMYAPASFAESGDFAGLPVATGPFKLVDWKRDEYLLLERNDHYWGPRPAVRRVRLRSIYERLQEIAGQDVPVLALYHELGPYAYRETLSGLKQRVTYQPTLDTIKLAK